MSRPEQHYAMDAALQPVVAALTELDEAELRALIHAVNGVPPIASGLLSRIERIADWELNRRAGLEFPPQPPDAAIPPEEDAHSIAAAVMMREQIVDGRDEADPLVALFDAILGALTERESLQ
jgi:hypothetical protein